MGNMFTAYIFKRKNTGQREEVRMRLFNLDGTPVEIGGGGLSWEGAYSAQEYSMGSVVRYGTHLYVAEENFVPDTLDLPAYPQYTGPVTIYGGPDTPVEVGAVVEDGNQWAQQIGPGIPVEAIFIRCLTGGTVDIVPSDFEGVGDGGFTLKFTMIRIDSPVAVTAVETWNGSSSHLGFALDGGTDYFLVAWDQHSPHSSFTGKVTLVENGACDVYTGPTPQTEDAWGLMV